MKARIEHLKKGEEDSTATKYVLNKILSPHNSMALFILLQYGSQFDSISWTSLQLTQLNSACLNNNDG
uniref:Uncharacterized protein n=1 Tax=Arundo donax TaxID=35708 RepID=A0A0A9DFI8_ARUDO